MQPVTIGLLWHSMNSDNLGVGALTLSNIAILRRACAAEGLEPRFLILGWRDPRPWYEDWSDVEMTPLRLRHIPGPGGPLKEGLKRCDIVFDIGGGDSFTDIYGFQRFFTVWWPKVRCWLNRTPYILSPQTVGPFDKIWSRGRARRVMNRARAVVTRDAPSTAFVKDMGVTAPILEVTDVAMGLPHDTPRTAPSDKVRVGLNVSGLLMSGGYTQSNQFGLTVDYPALIRDIITRMTARPEVELHLVGHVQSEAQPVEDDQRAGEALAAEFPGTVLAPVFTSPIEAKTYIAGMDFFMGARMHAAIAAFSSGVPVIPMAYSRKFKGVFGTLGYDHTVDCKSEDSETILAKIDAGYDNRAALKEEVARAMEGVTARLASYEDLARSEIARALKL